MTSTSPTEVWIELEQVAVAPGPGGQTAGVSGVNWQIRRGDYWVVAGSQGSGKSAVLSAAAGLQPPHQGQVRIFGQDFTRLDEEEQIRTRLRIGFVFAHGGRMFSGMNVKENVALPLQYHFSKQTEENVKRVTTVLALTELSEKTGLHSGSLSPSWRQRVGLARSLVLWPDILFLDQPLLGLERRHREWWMQFLDRLAAGIPELGNKSITLVVTTDELLAWREHGRQFALLRPGGWQILGGREALTVDPLWHD